MAFLALSPNFIIICESPRCMSIHFVHSKHVYLVYKNCSITLPAQGIAEITCSNQAEVI